MSELQEIFDSIDRNRLGQIGAKELQSALSIDFRLHQETCQCLIEMFDSNNDDAINFDEFTVMWNQMNQWNKCFRGFPTNSDGNTCIDKGKLRKTLTQFGYRISDYFCKFLLDKFARTSSSDLMIFDDFVQLCIALRALTDSFGAKDNDSDGFISVGYEEYPTLKISGATVNRYDFVTSADPEPEQQINLINVYCMTQSRYYEALSLVDIDQDHIDHIYSLLTDRCSKQFENIVTFNYELTRPALDETLAILDIDQKKIDRIFALLTAKCPVIRKIEIKSTNDAIYLSRSSYWKAMSQVNVDRKTTACIYFLLTARCPEYGKSAPPQYKLTRSKYDEVMSLMDIDRKTVNRIYFLLAGESTKYQESAAQSLISSEPTKPTGGSGDDQPEGISAKRSHTKSTQTTTLSRPNLREIFDSVDSQSVGRIGSEQLQHALSNSWSSFHSHYCQGRIKMVKGNIDINFDEWPLSNSSMCSFHSDTCQRLIKLFDSNGDCAINFNEFTAMWKQINQWDKCFRGFGTDSSENTCIDKVMLRSALGQLGYNLSAYFCDIVEYSFTRRCTRCMLFEEFVQLCVVLKNVDVSYRIHKRDECKYPDIIIPVEFEEFLIINLASISARIHDKMVKYPEIQEPEVQSTADPVNRSRESSFISNDSDHTKEKQDSDDEEPEEGSSPNASDDSSNEYGFDVVERYSRYRRLSFNSDDFRQLLDELDWWGDEMSTPEISANSADKQDPDDVEPEETSTPEYSDHSLDEQNSGDEQSEATFTPMDSDDSVDERDSDDEQPEGSPDRWTCRESIEPTSPCYMPSSSSSLSSDGSPS